MTEPTLWTYWDGPMPPVIELCLETLRRHNPTLTVVTPESLRDLGGGELLDSTAGLPRPQQSDLVRLWLIHRYGGCWVDSDCISMQPLDCLAEAVEVDLWGHYNPHIRRGYGCDGLLASLWGARAGSPAVAIALDRCRWQLRRMQQGHRVPYGATSVGLLSWLWKKYRGRYTMLRRQHWKYNRIPWHKARAAYHTRGADAKHARRPYHGPAVQLYHLTNVIGRDVSRETLLTSDRFVSFLFRRSLEID